MARPLNKQRDGSILSFGTAQMMRLRHSFAACALGISVGFVSVGMCDDLGSSHSAAHAASDNSASITKSWQLGNGEVTLQESFTFGQGHNDKLKNLHSPRLLGSGGGGAVFAFESPPTVAAGELNNKADEVAVKVSWVRSAESVKNECNILQKLEERRVQGVEVCLGEEAYPYDNRRVMIALQPVAASGSVASVTNLDERLQLQAVQSIVHTMVQLLAAGFVTTDVQPLISPITGDVLFIDFTEAQDIGRGVSSLIISVVSSFCSEMVALIPEKWESVAARTLLQDLDMISEDSMQPQLLELLNGIAASLA
jgi:hypothetical protein